MKKIKKTCTGSKNYATCISYEKGLPPFTKVQGDCATIEETTEDTYELIGELREQTDLSELGENCLTYIKDAENKIRVKEVLLKYEEEICLLKQKITDLETTDICSKSLTSCNLEFGTLVADCGEQITTVGQLFQALIDK